MAMRTQLDAVQIQLDAMIEEAQQEETQHVDTSCSVQGNVGSVVMHDCQHKKTIDVTTMGSTARTFLCRSCGSTLHKPFPLNSMENEQQPDGAIHTVS